MGVREIHIPAAGAAPPGPSAGAPASGRRVTGAAEVRGDLGPAAAELFAALDSEPGVSHGE
jgi:hypothetical protein